MSTPISEVPWMIENGAKHTVQVARNLSYMAAGGTEGIIRGAHLEVRETAVPGPQVRVFPGTAAILNRAAGATDEMYVQRVPVEETVDIAATSGSARSDLIVLRVENPWASGETWPDPADPTVGPYASLAVISNVAANTNSVDDLGLTADHSMIALARVDLPANTTVVTQAMVVDLRVMANAVSQRVSDIIAPAASDQLTGSAFSNWPNEATTTVDVPPWATHCRTRVLIAGVAATGSINGDLRVKIGSDITTQTTRINTLVSAGTDRLLVMCGSPKTPLPAADRGKRGTVVRVEGRQNSGSGTVTVDDKSTVSIEVEFINEPESNL